MRARLVILLGLVAVLAVARLPAALAQTQEDTQGGGGVVEQGDESTAENRNRGGEGRDPAAESGADEGQTGGAEETGPPWTYQMARISLVLLVLTLGAIGLAYYRLVVLRKREGF